MQWIEGGEAAVARRRRHLRARGRADADRPGRPVPHPHRRRRAAPTPSASACTSACFTQDTFLIAGNGTAQGRHATPASPAIYHQLHAVEVPRGLPRAVQHAPTRTTAPTRPHRSRGDPLARRSRARRQGPLPGGALHGSGAARRACASSTRSAGISFDGTSTNFAVDADRQLRSAPRRGAPRTCRCASTSTSATCSTTRSRSCPRASAPLDRQRPLHPLARGRDLRLRHRHQPLAHRRSPSTRRSHIKHRSGLQPFFEYHARCRGRRRRPDRRAARCSTTRRSPAIASTTRRMQYLTARPARAPGRRPGARRRHRRRPAEPGLPVRPAGAGVEPDPRRRLRVRCRRAAAARPRWSPRPSPARSRAAPSRASCAASCATPTPRSRSPARSSSTSTAGERRSSTGDDGSFLTYGSAPGPVTLEVVARRLRAPSASRPRWWRNGETPVEVLLTRQAAAGRPGARAASPIRRASRSHGHGALHQRRRARSSTPTSRAPGPFSAKLPAGDYTLDVVADGFLGQAAAGHRHRGPAADRRRVAHQEAGRRRTSRVGPRARSTVKGTIHFGTNNAEHPARRRAAARRGRRRAACAIRRSSKIRIEGHTDNRGDAAEEPRALQGARRRGGGLPGQAGHRPDAPRVARATARRSRWCRTSRRPTAPGTAASPSRSSRRRCSGSVTGCFAALVVAACSEGNDELKLARSRRPATT